ncbi:retinol dehydrogenase 13-like [Brachionus plicatilis]|uniref:Retinol dehydrogenase 13-like n=1 Tax=Brachionus plicatilis TaxID=10195 RepID=A0A3M7S7H3_BRAPC|nr:retinol dehydrogenase 13-like [Brachionus plicatilis]
MFDLKKLKSKLCFESVKDLAYFLFCLTPIGCFIFLTRKFYFSGGRCRSNVRLNGKTVIVTGSSAGIGKQTALDMARRGARVIMACRNLEKTSKVADQIRKETGNGNVAIELLDLASFDSIRQFCSRINEKEERIDVLINNAGVSICPKWTTKDGYELQFGVNYLGHFLLTNLLLDKIKKSAPSRIVNVASIVYIFGKIKWDDLNSEKSYGPIIAYCNSKLAIILFTRELAKKLKGTNVTTFSVHPGSIRSEAGRYLVDVYGWIAYFFQFLLKPWKLWFLKNAEEGAQTSIYCAVEEGLSDLSGSYFKDCQPGKLLPHALSDSDANKLWDLSEKLTNLK